MTGFRSRWWRAPRAARMVLARLRAEETAPRPMLKVYARIEWRHAMVGHPRSDAQDCLTCLLDVKGGAR